MLVAKSFRWTLLYAAIKKYVRHSIIPTLKPSTILIGEGAGGALAVGMVSKAIQELGHRVPLSLVIDCEYTGPGDPRVGMLLPTDLSLVAGDCLIIGSYAGTGRSLRVLKEKYRLQNTPVFCFVISRSLVDRERIEHYLIVGTRSIIPWPRSVPHPAVADAA